MQRAQRAGGIPSLGAWNGCSALILLLASCAVSMAGPDRRSRAESREHFEARQLFEKIWEEGTPAPAGGDGLGPLFNERSCVGCHHLGGVGGAGGNNSNVDILSVATGSPAALDRGTLFQGELEDLHPGFRTRTSIVVHEHATNPAAEARLAHIRTYRTVQTRDDVIALERSSRNTPALFGAGRLDSISDATLIEAENQERIVQPWGYTVFETIGCATCHAPRLGRVNGIYSDLLLHDLGDRMRASGGYGSPSIIVDRAKSKDQSLASGEASPTEWRTPPLWGVANSGPYLHDGRAETLDEAIRLHGGEAAATSERYGKLSTVDHNALILFLRSLTVSARPTKRSATAAAKEHVAKHGRL